MDWTSLARRRRLTFDTLRSVVASCALFGVALAAFNTAGALCRRAGNAGSVPTWIRESVEKTVDKLVK